MVKEYIDILIKPITNIVNCSLKEGFFPAVIKNDVITPLIKKPKLPKDDFKNYRPVSGLNFISKLIERVVAVQLKEHLSTNNLTNANQHTNQDIPLKQPC